MKFLVSHKHKIVNFIIILFLILLTILLIIPENKKEETVQVLNPINITKNYTYDLTGNGSLDTLSVMSKNDCIDIKILADNRTYYLSDLCKNNKLSSELSFWPIKIYIKNISRHTHPEIIVQGNIDKKAVNYIFTWKNDKFINILNDNKNILGILDSDGKKTSQICLVDSSSGIQSFNSYMLIDNKALDITSDGKTIYDINNIQKFIDIIEKTYEIDEIPNIFKEGISDSELSSLWNLDKEHNTYSFQNGFFYDENIDNQGNITSLKWTLNFEKYSKSDNNASNDQIVIHLTSERINDNTFKISSFYVS
ncbi:MAG: hypothetical protein E7214_00675 [Clostridium sp.]|nr:hypothetical protein [Clostridium sp.]